MSRAERIELGCAGHFIAAKHCHWRRHTQTRHYRISSVGELYFPHEPGVRQKVGAFGFFETMVFATTDKPAEGSNGCGCREVGSWSEIECHRYETVGEAQAGHEAMVAKYSSPEIEIQTIATMDDK